MSVSEPGPGRRLREESRAFGYRGIIASVVLLLLVLGISLSGAGRAVVCLLDQSLCASVPEPQATDPGLVTGALPAASDEQAVATGAGVGSVPVGREGRRRQVPLQLTQPVPASSHWSPPQPAPSSPPENLRLVALGSLPCGGSADAPCDKWAEIKTDAAAAQAGPASRLTGAGLDISDGAQGASDNLELSAEIGSLGLGVSVQGVEGDTTDSLVLHDLSRDRRDGSTSSSWIMSSQTGTGERALTRVRVNRTRDGVLHDIVLTRVVSSSADPNRLTWTTMTLPATDASRPALDAWTLALPSQGLRIPADLLEPLKPETVDMETVVRVAHQTASVRQEVLQASEPLPPLSVHLLRRNADHSSLGLTILSTHELSPEDQRGKRSFKEVSS